MGKPSERYDGLPTGETDSESRERWEALVGWAEHEPANPVADIVRVRFQQSDYERFRDHLVRGDGNEYAGYLLAGTHRYTDGKDEVFEFLVREVHLTPPSKYKKHGPGEVVLSHDVQWETIQSAGSDELLVDDHAVLIAHSHPWRANPRYSGRDNESEPKQLQPLTAVRSGPHGSLLFGADDTLTGRAWPDAPAVIRESTGAAQATPIDEIVTVGERELSRIRTTDSRLPDINFGHDQTRDRQALVHGENGNDRLRASHVAVVGVGGLGSLVILALAKMGVGQLTVVDPDIVETSNLSRLVGVEHADAGPKEATPDGDTVVPAQWAEAIDACGTPKVEAMERFVRSLDPEIQFRGVLEVAEERDALAAVLQADVVVTATDTHLSRRVVSNATQQYLRPLFDIATDINANDGTTKSITTRMSVSGSGRRCLDCLGVINENRIQAEQNDDEYGLTLAEGEQPSVISVNLEPVQRVSFALHRYLAGLWANRGSFNTGRHDFGSSTIFPENPSPNPECRFCSGDHYRSAGDRGPDIGKRLTRMTPREIQVGTLTELSDDELRAELERDTEAEDTRSKEAMNVSELSGAER